KRRRGVHDAVHNQRRRLKRAANRILRAVADIAGVIRPRDFELRDVGAIDLLECRILSVTRIAAVCRPLLSLCASGEYHQRRDAETPGNENPSYFSASRRLGVEKSVQENGGCPQATLGCGCPGSRFTQRYAAAEFFQKYFSAAAGPLP